MAKAAQQDNTSAGSGPSALAERGSGGGGKRPTARGSGGGAGSPSGAMPRGSRTSFFQLYKRGQGYYTRTGTAVGGGILIAGAFSFIYENLSFDQDWAAGLYLKIGIPLLVTVGLAAILWWVVGVNRRTCDFLIATEGEMKKVNWSTRREVIASTKVVIVVTFIMAVLLFVVDLAFMNFFQMINVLKSAQG